MTMPQRSQQQLLRNENTELRAFVVQLKTDKNFWLQDKKRMKRQAKGLRAEYGKFGDALDNANKEGR